MGDEFILEFLIKMGFKFSWRLYFRKLEKFFVILIFGWNFHKFKFDGLFLAFYALDLNLEVITFEFKQEFKMPLEVVHELTSIKNSNFLTPCCHMYELVHKLRLLHSPPLPQKIWTSIENNSCNYNSSIFKQKH